MIFDEADDPNLDLRPFFPECGHGNIIITTRNTIDRYTARSHCNVSRMDADDARQLLLGISQLDSTVQNASKAKDFVKVVRLFYL